MTTYKLNRPIQDGEDSITELKVKELHEINAFDIYGVSISAGGSIDFKSFIEPIANISGLTTAQAGVLSPKDFIYLSGVVGKSLTV
jgi:hypothetical protein